MRRFAFALLLALSTSGILRAEQQIIVQPQQQNQNSFYIAPFSNDMWNKPAPQPEPAGRRARAEESEFDSEQLKQIRENCRQAQKAGTRAGVDCDRAEKEKIRKSITDRREKIITNLQNPERGTDSDVQEIPDTGEKSMGGVEVEK